MVKIKQGKAHLNVLIWQHCHCSYYTFPGITLGTMPPVLPAVKQFLVADGSGEVAPISESSTSFPAMPQLLSEADVDDNGKTSLPLPTTATKPAAEILLGHGVPPLPRKIVERMINWSMWISVNLYLQRFQASKHRLTMAPFCWCSQQTY